MEAVAGLSVLLWLFLAAVAILWLFVPFAIFGIKGQLQQMAFQQKQTNELLRHLCKEQTGSVPATKF